MNYFFPNNIDILIKNPKFRQIFSEAPLLASTGAYYGFPVCCVEFFCNSTHNSFNSVDSQSNYPHPMNGTGYVPCPQCIERSKDKENFSNLINEHRFCPKLFPSNTEHNIDNDLHKFFAYLAYNMYKNPLKELKKYAHISYLINEILDENPIYLYYKDHKINVTAIGIVNKQDFGYMVENNIFCANQLENLLEWHKIQKSQQGVEFNYSNIWDSICKNEFDIKQPSINIKNIEPSTNHSVYLEETNHPNYKTESEIQTRNHQSIKRNIRKNHFSTV